MEKLLDHWEERSRNQEVGGRSTLVGGRFNHSCEELEEYYSKKDIVGRFSPERRQGTCVFQHGDCRSYTSFVQMPDRFSNIFPTFND